ncbi:MAG: hypothetical protein JSV03_15410, partial [Planctomycetota bacterium]
MIIRHLLFCILSTILFFNSATITLAADLDADIPIAFILKNKHLAVTFQKTDAGPRLAFIQYLPTGQTYRFDNSEEIALAIVRPEDINDPKLIPHYKLHNKFQLAGINVDPDKSKAAIQFADDSLEAQIKYQLYPDAPVLQKTMVCTARERSVYIAGICLWNLKPVGLSLIWPKSKNTWGQPSVLIGSGDGCFITSEWPRSRNSMDTDGKINIEHRPGYNLKPGRPHEVATGAIGFFECKSESTTEKLEAARQSFFAHMVRRIN